MTTDGSSNGNSNSAAMRMKMKNAEIAGKSHALAAIFKSILFLFYSIFPFFMYSCENNIDKVNLITASDKTPLQSEENAEYAYTDSAKTRFILKAPVINTFGGKNPYQECPKGMSVDFYDDSGRISSHINSDYAIRYENTKIMEADGNVVVINKKGEKLNTEQLFWDQSKHTIYTPKYVQIRTSTEILLGDGLQSNEDFTHYTITNIRGTVQLDNPAQ